MRTVFLWAVLIVLPTTLFAAAVQTAMLPDGTEYISDRLIVTTRVGTPPLAVEQVTSGAALTGVSSIDYLCAEQNVVSIEPFYTAPIKNPILRDLVSRMYILHVTESQDVQTACQAFKADPNIESADLYDIPKTTYYPNDPSRTSQWHLTRTHAYEAWDIIRGDSTSRAVIGIVDTGVYWAHPDLNANIWVNPGEDTDGDGVASLDDANGIDDDANGYTDDIIGWDSGTSDNNPNENTPTHGTHVAGCASEVTDNAIGGAGLGFSASLMAVKGANSQGQLTAVYQGMIYASDNGAHVVNCSWGSAYYSQSNQNIINGLWSAGTLVIAAAGNDGNSSLFYPAAYNHVLSVAATNSSDRKASFSNYGTWIDISAPGDNIYATWAQSSYQYLSGTSMASPVCAGLAGLLKAANPSWGPDDIAGAITATADDIDDLNPSYRGQLGAGRINAFRALGSLNYPNVVLTGEQVTITNDDGNGTLNPGESLELVITLSNSWADAHNVNATVSCSLFTAVDTAAAFGDILHGQAISNLADPFRMTVQAGCSPGMKPLAIHITADSSYVKDTTITVYVSMAQAGFPIDIPGNIDSSPIIYDFDLDGANEIIFGSLDRNIYAIEANGENSPGWPKSVTNDIISGPAIGDLDNDGVNEVVAVCKDGKIYAWHANGSPVANFPVDKGGLFYGGPLLVNMDDDSNLEIVIGSFTDYRVYVIENDGSDHVGWPATTFNRWYGSASSGNFDSDAAEEIVYAGFDSLVHVWNSDGTELAGFPVHVNGQVWTAASVGNIDGDPGLEIVVVTYNGSCFLINSSGVIAPGFPVTFSTSVRSTPALADLNADGDLEIIFGTADGVLHVLDETGAELTGFPKTVTGSIFGSPVVGDINGDGQPDIMVGTLSGNIYGFDRTGSTISNFPMMGESTRQISASLALGDLDRDGDIEIVAPIKAIGQNLVVIDYRIQASIANMQWPCFGKDPWRSNDYEHQLTAVDETPVTPTSFSLSQNYPNPFNGNTAIRFSLENAGEATLGVFDLLGRRVKTLHSGVLLPGEHTFTWNGTDEAGDNVTSGVYFYRLQNDGQTLTKRMVMLK